MEKRNGNGKYNFRIIMKLLTVHSLKNIYNTI